MEVIEFRFGTGVMTAFVWDNIPRTWQKKCGLKPQRIGYPTVSEARTFLIADSSSPYLALQMDGIKTFKANNMRRHTKLHGCKNRDWRFAETLLQLKFATFQDRLRFTSARSSRADPWNF
jgi:hypothetical protein